MNNETLKKIQEQIGYDFENPDLLQQAFIRRSYSAENGGGDNEVLEFIGDKALDFVIVKLLAEKYGSWSKQDAHFDPEQDYNEYVSVYKEGELTEIKKMLVKKETLAGRIDAFGLAEYLILGKGDINNNVAREASVKEDLFEAIIGAVALDSNWNLEKLQDVIDILLEPDYYINDGTDNCVTLIQKWTAEKYNVFPRYHFEVPKAVWYFAFDGVSGEYDYNRDKYTCLMKLGDFEKVFRAFGETKKEAREKVCQLAYDYLKTNNLLLQPIDEVGAPDFERAINQLQELYQKGYIGKPWYAFSETYDDNGNPVWHCECRVEGHECYFEGDYTSKKYGKKAVAYEMVKLFLGWEKDDET